MNKGYLIAFLIIIQALISCSSSSKISKSEQQLPEETVDDVQDETVPQIQEENTTEAQPDPAAEAKKKEDDLKNSIIEYQRDQMYATFQNEANTLSNYYIAAQQGLYSGDFENALIQINRAAEIRESADILALRGSIYLGLQNTTEFVNQWRKALEMDPEVPIPPVAYIIQQLQLYRLIDQNLKKAF